MLEGGTFLAAIKNESRSSRSSLKRKMSKMRLWCLKLAFFVGAMTLTGLAASAQTLGTRQSFSSYTPKTMFDFARERRQNWAEQAVQGDLSLPAQSGGKVPAVVLMHGSAGVEPSMAQWVEALNAIGVATFVVRSFDARGVKRTVEDQSLVPAGADLMDAFQALVYLASNPRIDAQRIGVMGFSRGGTVAFRTAVEAFRKTVVKSDLRFAFHIPVYAGCAQVYWSPQLSSAPILNLVGTADDYTTAELCERLAKRYADAGASVRTIKYPDAHHSWDGLYKVFHIPKATTATPCGVVRWDMDTWKVTAEATGVVIPPTGIDEFFKTCRKLGAHAGRNEFAFQKSRKDVQDFVKSIVFKNYRGSRPCPHTPSQTSAASSTSA
jgi:dienelactone hydrolase